ncbi:MAG: hypothetical protein DMG34_19165 [Acidobacteria bacterium]|nr:MAG: hypothetical protein DMG34_19165 [Acidobacteriota bacterium]
MLIRVWTRTAVRKEITSFGTFPGTLVMSSAIISTSIASDFGTLGTLEVFMSGQVRSTTIRKAHPQKNYSGFR